MRFVKNLPSEMKISAQSKTAYQPVPIDTQAVQLPRALTQLTEKLAEHTHDVWAAQRIKDGWTFGSQRDDKAKQHPCLVPYSALPESEKEYDRQTALGILKAVLALGYRIDKIPS
jgi:ryanodine receptor 2